MAWSPDIATTIGEEAHEYADCSVSSETSRWFPTESSARILMVCTLPSQSAAGITSMGTPVISPTPKTTSVSSDTVQPTGRLRTCRLIVVGALPRLCNSARG